MNTIQVNKKQYTESEVIALAKQDTSYFGILYNHYFDSIFRFIFKRIGGDEESTADLTQQTFIKALKNISGYEDRGFKFSSWLYRIAQNEVNMFFRSQKTQHSVEISDHTLRNLQEEAELDRYMSQEEQEQLIELINQLEPEQQEIIELRFFQELSFRDIAEIYSISEANAKMRVYRILEKLTKKWKGHDTEI